MVAAPIVAEDKEVDEHNVFAVDEELKLLKSAAVYGANASGKSNLAKAMGFMRWFMINSSKNTQSTEPIAVEPFRLSTETEKQPSYFEIIFLMEGTQYRYGFELDASQVLSEWLFYVPKVRETQLFSRHQEKIDMIKKYQGQTLKSITRPNALFLSVCAQFNVKIASEILDWVENKFKIVSGLDDRGYRGYTARCLNQKNQYSEAILKLIKKLDLGISDLDVEEVEITEEHLPEHFPEELKNFILNNNSKMPSVNTFHKKYNAEGKLASTEIFDLEEQESEGTQKLFEIAGPLVDTLFDGKVLVIDEFDARLHPLINQPIVKLFNSVEDNPSRGDKEAKALAV
jgi:AAA15 family ATPase/GTPase